MIRTMVKWVGVAAIGLTLNAAPRSVMPDQVWVPENRITGQGRQIPLNFVVLRADAPNAREAVFLLAGGPGQGSTIMSGVAQGWMRPLRATMDVVLMDQRGTGGSGALNCPTDLVAEPAAAFGHVLDPKVMQRCRLALEAHADLTQYTTDAAVADMEDLRVRLGYDRIAVYGVSYGTRLAQAYLRRHPERTKAVVLDGVIPFDTPVPLTYARHLQRAIDLVLAGCRERTPCREAHPNLTADFATLLTRLGKAPARATVRPTGGTATEVIMTKEDFLYAVRGVLYEANALDTLPPLITRATATGNFDEFAQRYWTRAQRLGQGIAMGLHLSVFCAEDVPYPTEADIAAAVSGTAIGRYLIDDYRRACAAWPRAPVAADFRRPVTARVPVVLVSGRFDPATPPENGEQVARSLPLARHFVSPTGSHGVAAGCPREAVLHVLSRGTLEGLPEVCPSPAVSPAGAASRSNRFPIRLVTDILPAR